jgi:ATP/maltotriose-dependent transcriptional regulator MalT
VCQGRAAAAIGAIVAGVAGAKPLDEVPFVGRRRELGVLQQALADAASGIPRLVLVEGDAGIGKTTLVRTFLQRNPDVAHVWASGDETELSLRLGVVDQIRASITSPPPHRSTVTRNPDSFAVGAELLEALGAVPDDQTLIVVVDDLHWADPDSTRALLFWLRRLGQDCVLVVCTARPHVTDTLGESWSRLLADTGRSRRTRMSGLSAAEVATLADHGGDSLPAAAAERLRSHTAGNPLYVAGLLAELPRASLCDSSTSLPAPHSYAATVLSRTAALSPAAQDLVAPAAVLGVRSPLPTALATAGTPDGSAVLDEAVTHQLLITKPRGAGREVSFRHPLVRAAVYDDLSPARRRALHLAAARVLPAASALAHRVAATDGLDEHLAAELADTADADLARGNAKDAAEHLFWSADLEPDPEHRQGRLLRGEELLLISGDVPGAQSHAGEIEALPDSDLKRYVLAALAAGLGDLAGARTQFRELASGTLRSAEPGLYARVTAGLSCVAAVVGDADEAIEQARASLGVPDPPATTSSIALQALAFGLAQYGRISAGLELLAGVSERARAPAPFGAELLLTRGMLRVWNGDSVAAVDDLQAVLRWAKVGHPVTSVVTAYGYLAEAEYHAGEWDEALAHAELASSLGHDLDHTWYLAYVHRIAAQIHIGMGNKEAAAAHADSAFAAVKATPHPVARAHAAIAAATVAAALDEWDGVLAALAPLRDELRPSVADHPALLPWRLLESEAHLAQGRVNRAGSVLDYVAQRPAGTQPVEAEYGRLRAKIRQASGAESLTLLADALDRALPDGDAFAVARLQLDLGRAQLAAGRANDARTPLTAARRRIAELSARPLLDECDIALAECGVAADPVARPAFDALTRREEVVARLVTRGMTNREIAAELYVTTKTIEYHVGNIFTKLGITTRRDLWPVGGPQRPADSWA